MGVGDGVGDGDGEGVTEGVGVTDGVGDGDGEFEVTFAMGKQFDCVEPTLAPPARP